MRTFTVWLDRSIPWAQQDPATLLILDKDTIPDPDQPQLQFFETLRTKWIAAEIGLRGPERP